jgi:CrcB protein
VAQLDVEHLEKGRTGVGRMGAAGRPVSWPPQSGEARSLNRGDAANGLYVDDDLDAEVVVESNKPEAPTRSLDLRELGAIFAGGALGAGIRTGLVELAPTQAGQWPWVTFAVNVVGSFLLGYFITRLQERLPVTAYRRPLLGTGLCGALSTFSTFQLDLLKLLDHDQLALAVIYAGASIAAGFLGFAFGTAIVRRARLTW